MNNLISAFIGTLIAVMIMINGTLSNALGNYTSTMIIHIIGLIAIILVLLASRQKFIINKNIPFYLYSAGAIGVFTVLFNNLTFSSLGVSLTLALGLLGQSVASVIIDHFGLLGMKVMKYQKKKLIGLVFIILGIVIMAVF
ncbi:DMT family transporter [Clostridium sp. YIM B02515]|uniref:DMT family transporter n=1 Tax=Clostridium rhizosphaerae TaxID=2803861 RepID=A0ABS1TGP3_9CLOT|nr:DMT family transporter [Clostridium rhizosphaerae]MBL4938563.1 DMT family transporter [Clostridium rhizosphaerae]